MNTQTTTNTKPKRKYTRRAEKFSKKAEASTRRNPAAMSKVLNSFLALSAKERLVVAGIITALN